MLNTGLSITLNGETLPMVFVDYRFAYSDAACGIDDRRLDLLKQVENCAKKLKREDFRRVALVKLVMGDENLILDIARWFEEEDIEVACIYSNKLTLEQFEKLNPNFEYGVINDWTLLEEMKREKESGSGYHKTR